MREAMAEDALLLHLTVIYWEGATHATSISGLLLRMDFAGIVVMLLLCLPLLPTSPTQGLMTGLTQTSDQTMDCSVRRSREVSMDGTVSILNL